MVSNEVTNENNQSFLQNLNPEVIDSEFNREQILEQSVNMSDDTISFLNNAILKSKNLNRNKLQIDLENCMSEIYEYKKNVILYKNNIEQLTKEKNVYIEQNEKMRSDQHKLLMLNEELNKQINQHLEVINTEKNINNNFKVSYETQLSKLKLSIEQLHINLNTKTNEYNELNMKFNELIQRYNDLTTLYSRQTTEFEIAKRNAKHLSDELNTASSNNKQLHDEINSIKQETVQHLHVIEELKKIAALPQPMPPSSKAIQPIVNTMTSVTAKQKTTSNKRGIKVTNR